MAVEKAKISTKLILVLQEADGKTTTSKSYSRINAGAEDQVLLDAAQAIGGLQTLTLDGVRLGETYSLTES